ncbi:MAG: A/G-specific adenine glycosylase [Pelosinus sp.]|nr:A/G-specific adenine glycosylase [Pelosinus sp.]
MTLSANLLDWYDRNRRELPWRIDKDPYKIWVSEIMLQQTRVEAVKEYYTRWLRRFPTPYELAAAEEEEVLYYWQGLGYYNRARNLQAAMSEVCAAYGGEIPNDEAALKALPGIGEYTAGAILSIAFDCRTPAVDGNVLRIFSRLFYVTEDITKSKTKRLISRLVSEYISLERPGDFNQALMDLGAMVCIPQTPRCAECPVLDFCQAYALDVQCTLPVKPAAKAPRELTLVAGIIQRGGEYLIRRRPSGNVLAGMWEFPAIEICDESCEKATLEQFIYTQFALKVLVQEKAFNYVHIFSHLKWYINFYHCQCFTGEVLFQDTQWIALSEWENITWAGPHRKAAEALWKNSVGGGPAA